MAFYRIIRFLAYEQSALGAVSDIPGYRAYRQSFHNEIIASDDQLCMASANESNSLINEQFQQKFETDSANSNNYIEINHSNDILRPIMFWEPIR